MSDVTRLRYLLNTMQSSILKKYLSDVCTRKEFLETEYKLIYSKGGYGSLLEHVIDVAMIARSLWEMRENELNYDYLMVGALLHEHKCINGIDIISDFMAYLRNVGVCSNAIDMLLNMLSAPLCEVNNVTNTIVVEAIIIKKAKATADALLLCNESANVKDGQKYFLNHPTIPILSKPIKVE